MRTVLIFIYCWGSCGVTIFTICICWSDRIYKQKILKYKNVQVLCTLRLFRVILVVLGKLAMVPLNLTLVPLNIFFTMVKETLPNNIIVLGIIYLVSVLLKCVGIPHVIVIPIYMFAILISKCMYTACT